MSRTQIAADMMRRIGAPIIVDTIFLLSTLLVFLDQRLIFVTLLAVVYRQNWHAYSIRAIEEKRERIGKRTDRLGRELSMKNLDQ